MVEFDETESAQAFWWRFVDEKGRELVNNRVYVCAKGIC